MPSDLLARFAMRSLVLVCAVCAIEVPVRGEDTDVFELLTGRKLASSKVEPAEHVEPRACNAAPQQSDGVDLAVGFGSSLEPAQDLEPTDYTLVAQAEELQPGTVQPTPLSEMSLSRPIVDLNASPTTPEFIESMNNLPEKFHIKNYAESAFGSWAIPRYSAMSLESGFPPSGFFWAAPAVFHRPLYFEQPNVERYGHYVACCKGGNWAQSAISAAHFFGTIPVLPYKIGADPCCERHYVLGTYRPGSCNPHQLVKPKYSCCGLVLQGITVTGLIFLIP